MVLPSAAVSDEHDAESLVKYNAKDEVFEFEDEEYAGWYGCLSRRCGAVSDWISRITEPEDDLIHPTMRRRSSLLAKLVLALSTMLVVLMLRSFIRWRMGLESFSNTYDVLTFLWLFITCVVACPIMFRMSRTSSYGSAVVMFNVLMEVYSTMCVLAAEDVDSEVLLAMFYPLPAHVLTCLTLSWPSAGVVFTLDMMIMVCDVLVIITVSICQYN